MRRGRIARLGWLAGMAAVTAIAGRAAGEEDSVEPIRLEYHADDGCPDRAAFEARVAARTTRARFVTGEGMRRTFVLDLRGGTAPSGVFAVSRGGHGEGLRNVHADTCADVADALALFVALAVDPSALAGPSAAPGSTAPAASAAPSASVAPPASSAPAASVAPVDPPAPPARPPSLQIEAAAPIVVEASATPASAPPHSVFVSADFAVATGISPDALIGVAPAVGWRSSSRSLIAPEIRIAFLRAASGTVVASPGEASFTWTVGRADGCVLSWPPGALRLQACARVEAGVLDAAGTQIAAAQSRTRGWFATGPLVRGEWDLLAPLFLEAEVAAMVHVTADRFYFQPNTTIYQVPLLGLGASAGLGVHFL